MRNYIATIIGVFIMVVLAVVAFRVAKFIYIGLLYLLPLFLIITFFVNRRVLFDHFRYMFGGDAGKFKLNILRTVISMLALPLMGPVLLIKALLYNKLKEKQQEFAANEHSGFPTTSRSLEEQYIEFEDLSEQPARKPEPEKRADDGPDPVKLW